MARSDLIANPSIIGATPDTPLTGSTSLKGGNGGQTEYEPNILSDYRQVAYHFTFYAGDDSGNPGPIIAETGITTFNIRDVQFDAVVAPGSKNRNSLQTKVRITITEPMGAAFMDALYLSMNQTGAKNWQKGFYILELRFMGYDEDGTPNKNLCSSFPNGGTWRWKLFITDIDVHVDAGGGTYTITAIPSWYGAQDKEAFFTQVPYTVEAKNVGDFLKDFAEKLNKSVYNANGTGRYKSEIFKYEFKIKDINGQDPTSWEWSKADQDKGRNTYRHLSFQEGSRDIPRITINRGANIADVVNDVLAATEKGQALIRDSKRPDAQAREEVAGVESIVWMVYSDLQFNGFDEETNNYKKAITYTVRGFETLGIIPDPKKATATEQEALNRLKQGSRLKKKYDYIYTGLNTEVKDFDIKFNFAWQAAMPRYDGKNFSIDNVMVGAKIDDESRKYAGVKAIAGAASAGASALAGIAGPFGGGLQQAIPILGQVGQQVLGQGNTQVNNFIQGLQSRAQQLVARQQPSGGASSLSAQLANLRNNQPASAGSAASGGSRVFAEDLLSTVTENPLKLSETQVGEAARVSAGDAIPGQYHEGKSIFGALIDQIYAPFSVALLNINLTIKGDPFWLGLDVPDMLAQSGGSPKVANFLNGDTCFILHLRYPYNYGETGNPELRTQDVFNGVYRAIEVTSNFSNGEFTQVIKAIRVPKVNAKALNLDANPDPSRTAGRTTGSTGLQP